MDARAFLHRCAEKLFSLPDRDAQRLAAVLYGMQQDERPIPFERYLGIPEQWAGSSKSLRNHALLRAAAGIVPHDHPAPERLLHDHWTVFADRLFPAWRSAETTPNEPPEEATDVQRCLYRALRFNRDKTLSLRQIRNIWNEARAAGKWI